jgi:hypothetical protein
MANELKTKAMILGNKLAPRMGGNRQEALRRLARYTPRDVRVFLVPEPANPVDPAAIAVMVGVQGGRGLYKLGYIPRTAAPLAAAGWRGNPGRVGSTEGVIKRRGASEMGQKGE